MATFDFPDADMGYNEELQDGFAGKGTSEIEFIHSSPLTAEITLNRTAADIRLSSDESHEIDFDLLKTLGRMNNILGCIRIEGPTLRQLSINGSLESSASAGGILGPKAGYVVDVIVSMTPTTSTFLASGDILLQAGGAAIDISGYVSLRINYRPQDRSAEGEFYGVLNCSSVLGGLEGTGQVTWFIGSDTQCIQGKIQMKVCSWAGSAGLEGGLFIGNNVPKEKAWVLLYTGNEHFGISADILPTTLTGLYGYGRVSMGISWGFISGGYELFAGMGAFVTAPNGKSSSWSLPGFPYVLGSCGVYVHGEILWGLVSASAWANLDFNLGPPPEFEGEFGLKGCVLWVFCASISLRAGLNSDGFYAEML